MGCCCSRAAEGEGTELGGPSVKAKKARRTQSAPSGYDSDLGPGKTSTLDDAGKDMPEL